LALVFWLKFRYPALDDKALMGGEMPLSGIGFSVVAEVLSSQPVAQRVLNTTLNWIATNQQGMTFGVLFAATMTTLLGTLRRRTSGDRRADTGFGTLFGGPLGVCVNCAAPIAFGLRRGGASVETAVAVMVSSPSLNIVVLSMAFALLPPHLAMLKVIGTVALLALIPVLTRLTVKMEASPPLDVTPQCPLEESWIRALGAVAIDLGRSLGRTLVRTVPLMLLAGLLGSVLIEMFPLDVLASLPEPRRLGFARTGLVLAGLSILGTALPVPISFDVLAVVVLLAAGMPPLYGMVLLFTLGPFSLYAFMLVWRFFSRPLAVALFFSVAAIGTLTGFATELIQQTRLETFEAKAEASFAKAAAYDPQKVRRPTAESAESLGARLPPIPRIPFRAATVAGDPVSIDVRSNQPRTTAAGPLFERLPGSEIGLDEMFVWSGGNKTAALRSIAAGDVHNDGLVDIVISRAPAAGGLTLYSNAGGKFVRQQILSPRLDALPIVNVALVDLNNDGWLDLFVGSLYAGHHALYNDGRGGFDESRWEKLPDRDAYVAYTAAFGDLNRDGQLEIALGRSTLYAGPDRERGRSLLLWRRKGGYAAEPLSGEPSQSLSSLMTDVNGDGALDLVIGNDGWAPDVIYQGDGQGSLQTVRRTDGLVPRTTTTTMSLSSADVDNDLSPELYFAQASYGAHRDHYRKVRPQIAVTRLCDYESTDTRKTCLDYLSTRALFQRAEASMDPDLCQGVPLEGRNQCLFGLARHAAALRRSVDPCRSLPERLKLQQWTCESPARPEGREPGTREEAASPKSESLPQAPDTNVLLSHKGAGPFLDLAEAMNVHLTGWSWSARFADLDQDGWQDLYVVNGSMGSLRDSNLFLRNESGRRFVEQTESAGLLDYTTTGAFVYIDVDGDGDLDILSINEMAQVRFFRNTGPSGRSIAFELDDHRGNRFGLGSKITITTTEGSKQMREIQAGGGFLSSNAPIAHFGLGIAQEVSIVEVRWSTGEISRIEGHFKAPAQYRIRRAGSVR
jgi:uncharacterized membrane protein YraQ (UPF0718 family)